MHAFETMANSNVSHYVPGHAFHLDPLAVHGEQTQNDAVDLGVGDYDDLVAQGKALFEEDIARFDCPDLDDRRMMWGSAEYFRWYSADGKKRQAPLDYDELLELIMYRERCTAEDAEHEVSLNSRARVGDKAKWELVVKLGYLDWTREFARGIYGVD